MAEDNKYKGMKGRTQPRCSGQGAVSQLVPSAQQQSEGQQTETNNVQHEATTRITATQPVGISQQQSHAQQDPRTINGTSDAHGDDVASIYPGQDNLRANQAIYRSTKPYHKTLQVLGSLLVMTILLRMVLNQNQLWTQYDSLDLKPTEQFQTFVNHMQGVFNVDSNQTQALSQAIPPSEATIGVPAPFADFYRVLRDELLCRPLSYSSSDLDNSLYGVLNCPGGIAERVTRYLQEESTTVSQRVMEFIREDVVELLAFYENFLKILKDVKNNRFKLGAKQKHEAEEFLRRHISMIASAIHELQLFGHEDITNTVSHLIDILGFNINEQWGQVLGTHLYFNREQQVKSERSYEDCPTSDILEHDPGFSTRVNRNGGYRTESNEVVEAEVQFAYDRHIGYSWVRMCKEGRAVIILAATNIPSTESNTHPLGSSHLLQTEVERGARFIVLYKTARDGTDEKLSIDRLTKATIPIPVFKVLVRNDAPVVSLMNRRQIYEIIRGARPVSGGIEQSHSADQLTWEEVVHYLLNTNDPQNTETRSNTSPRDENDYPTPQAETQEIRNQEQETQTSQIPRRFESMRFTDPPGDGNCQFAAIARQLWTRRGIKVSPQELRSQAVDYLSKTIYLGNEPEAWDSFLVNEKRNDYLARMGRDTEWGDQITIQALANIYKLQIVVLSSVDNRGMDHVVSANGDNLYHRNRPFLVLGHILESHYMSLEIDARRVVTELPIVQVR